MFKKPKPVENVPRPAPVEIKNQTFEEPALEVQHNEPKVKKPEVSTEQVEPEANEVVGDTEELTEEAIKRILENLNFRISRIEHHLRLDY